MKNKYQRMNKEEKKKLIAEYQKTEVGKNQLFRLKRLLIIGIVLIIFGILEILVAYFTKNGIWDYISGVICIITGIIFIISSFRIKGNSLNNFAIKKK